MTQREEMGKTLTFPVDCDTPAKRTEYCYRAQELLRLLHNKMGKWYREGGVIQTQWNALLPQKLKKRYPYKAQITEAEWRDFTDNVFMPISERIEEKLNQNRELLLQSTAWQINVEDI